MTLLRPVTVSLIEAIFNDIEPAPNARMAFGINSECHLDVLRAAILSGRVDAERLDAAISSGAKITGLVNSVGCNPLGISFQPAWDPNGCNREGEKSVEPREREQEREF